MLKATGIFLILCSGLGLGRTKCREIRERERCLRTIIQMLQLLKEEIRYGNTPLPEAFFSISEKQNTGLKEFLCSVAHTMKEGKQDSVSESIRSNARKASERWLLSKEEKEAFCAFGEHLGYLDLNVQIRELDRQIRIFEIYLEEHQKKMPGLLRLYQSMGVILAVLFSVILW